MTRHSIRNFDALQHSLLIESRPQPTWLQPADLYPDPQPDVEVETWLASGWNLLAAVLAWVAFAVLLFVVMGVK